MTSPNEFGKLTYFLTFPLDVHNSVINSLEFFFNCLLQVTAGTYLYNSSRYDLLNSLKENAKDELATGASEDIGPRFSQITPFSQVKGSTCHIP